MSLLVSKEGILTTVQDLGRYGFRFFGVNPSGVMDRSAARIVNIILGNDENAALIELHFPAGEFLFEAETPFALGGADFSPELSNTCVPLWTTVQARGGDVLKFRKKRAGNRAYLAVAGGFHVDKWLDSASTSLVTGMGGFNGRRILFGDHIPFKPVNSSNKWSNLRIGNSLIPAYSSSPKLRITAGPEFDMLTGIGQQHFLSGQFVVSPESNRMGFRLQGPSITRLTESEILSSGTTFGTVQLLPDGQLIVLMADHQTTGGYPRIATITAVDLPLIAQLGSGDEISFELIDLEAAENLLLDLERDIAFLKTGLRLRRGAL